MAIVRDIYDTDFWTTTSSTADSATFNIDIASGRDYSVRGIYDPLPVREMWPGFDIKKDLPENLEEEESDQEKKKNRSDDMFFDPENLVM